MDLCYEKDAWLTSVLMFFKLNDFNAFPSLFLNKTLLLYFGLKPVVSLNQVYSTTNVNPLFNAK